MKKILAVALSVIMLLGIIPFAAMAADNAMLTFDFESNKAEVEAGEVFDVTFSVTGAEDAASCGWSFQVLVPDGLTFVEGSSKIDTATQSAMQTPGDGDWTYTESTRMLVNVGVSGLKALNQKNVIFTFQVKANEDASGEYEIGVDLTDTNSNDVLDEYCDTLDSSKFAVNNVVVKVVDHICKAEKLTAKEAVAPTCTEDGSKAYYECECGLAYEDADATVAIDDVVIPALGHTEGEATKDNEVAPGCENKGSYEAVVCCTVCGEELSRTPTDVDALGHNYKSEVTDPTCTKGGYTTYTCTVCGDSYKADETEALGHTEGEVTYENVSNATCTEGGTGDAVIYCSVCGEELSRVTSTVPALGHTEAEATKEKDVAPTCTEDGSYDMVVYCEVCGEEVSRETTVVPALGHTEAEATKEKDVAPTCTEDGSYDMVVYCSVCGEELSRETTVVPATGHTEAEAIKEKDVAPTCTADGSYDMVVYCSVCGKEISRETTVVPATGHNYESVETAPTCTEAGYTTYTCSVCGDKYVADEVAALGHTEGEWVEDSTTKGLWVLPCTVCGAILDDDLRAVAPTGIKLDQNSVEVFYVRKAPAFTLTETVLPEDKLLLDYDVIWTSSNEKVATVDEDGNVTTHKRGEATITATLVDAEGNEIASADCAVKVKYTFCQWLIWFFLLGCCWYFV